MPPPIAIVGCGAVTQLFYAPALSELQRHSLANVVALCDPNLKAREALQSSFGAASLQEKPFKAPSENALAIIASPPKFHAEQTRQWLELGWNVLCEKPMASSPSECLSMIEAAQKAQRILAVGHYKRFMPAHQAIKQLIDARTFGKLIHLKIREGGKFSWPAASDSFFKKEQTPGGVLLDIGVHALDLVLWWLGEPSSFTYADDAQDGLEANAHIQAGWMTGYTADILFSRDWKTENTYTFQFERATITCRVNASNQLDLSFDGIPMTFAAELREPLVPQTTARPQLLSSNPQAFIDQIVDVLSACSEGRAPLVSGIDGARAITWISQCYSRRQPLIQSWMKTL